MDNLNQPKELKVVIVEDNIALADIYKTRLELIGYKCFVANEGEAALETIRRELPDLVLLDLMVPKIAGDEILRRLRISDWGKKIRVFIISNLDEVDAPKGLRDLGIEGYIVKANMSNDQLDQLVDNILKPAGQTETTSLEEQTIIPHDDATAEAQPAAEESPIEQLAPIPISDSNNGEPETPSESQPDNAPEQTSPPPPSEPPPDIHQKSL